MYTTRQEDTEARWRSRQYCYDTGKYSSTAGARNASQGSASAHNASMRSASAHCSDACRSIWVHVGVVNAKGDVGDGDEPSPQGRVMSKTLPGEGRTM